MGIRPTLPALARGGWRPWLGLALLFGAVFTGLPARAASSLSAWRVSREGVLELRTSPGIQVRAFYEEGLGGRGPRIWFDLPGAPLRARSLWLGYNLREVRIGRPDDATTRLVLEFQPGTRLDPRQLRLVGTARDRWRMELPPTATRLGVTAGEGDFESAPRALAVRLPPPRVTSRARAARVSTCTSRARSCGSGCCRASCPARCSGARR
jgi:N-acetylmuramoyl-L-alanine amidase